MSFSVYFDKPRKRYIARWWISGAVDIKATVPASFWVKYGLETPTRENAKSEKLALQWAAGEANKRLGAKARGRTMTVAEVYALMSKENPGKVSELTLKRWAGDWANLKEHLDDGLLPRDVDESVQVRYRNAREKDGVRQRTIKNEIMFLRQIVLFAFRWKKTTGATVIDLGAVPAFDAEERSGIALTVDEVGLLLSDETWTKRYGRLVVAGIASGLRKGPLFGLRSEWIDRETRILEIPASEMKGGRSFSVPVCETFLLAVPDVAGAIFAVDDGERAPRWVYEGWAVWADSAKVRRFTPHDLRRTFATWLAEDGVDELTIGALLGHSSGGSTLGSGLGVTRGYIRRRLESLRDAVATIDDRMKPVLLAASRRLALPSPE